MRVWDPRVNEPVLALETQVVTLFLDAWGGCCFAIPYVWLCFFQVGGTPRDCWAVAFGNSYNDAERCVCAGYDNGDIKMFDLRTTGTLWETNVDNGITGIQFDRQDIEMNKLVVTTLESRYKAFRVRRDLNSTNSISLSTTRQYMSLILCILKIFVLKFFKLQC